MSTILFLGHGQVSHAYDTFFNGCVNVFGIGSVFTYPVLDKYHSSPDYDPAELHTDIQPVYGWWCKNHIPRASELTLAEWADRINSLEVQYVVGSNRAIDNFIKLVSLLDVTVLTRICVVFIEEDHDLGFELHRNNLEKLEPIMDRIDIFYKMDYVQSAVGHYDCIHPFYMSCPDKIVSEVGSIKPFKDRSIDICFMTEANHPDRIAYFNLIKDMGGNNVITCGAHKLSLRDYFRTINDSKIFISVRGNEWSNTRNIEGPRLGAALFTDSIDITVPFNYVNDVSAVFFSGDTLVNKLEEYLQDIDRLEALAAASQEHCLKFHTTTARAYQMIHLAKKLKGWQ